MQASRDYVVGQVIQCLEEIVAAVENRPSDSETDDYNDEEEEPGQFISAIDKVVIVIECCW